MHAPFYNETSIPLGTYLNYLHQDSRCEPLSIYQANFRLFFFYVHSGTLGPKAPSTFKANAYINRLLLLLIARWLKTLYPQPFDEAAFPKKDSTFHSPSLIIALSLPTFELPQCT